MSEWLEGRVCGRRQWADQLYSLQIEAPLTEFIAGQYIKVALEIGEQTVGRPYSLVNAPDERPLEIYFNEVPEGPMSNRLSALEIGTRLWISAKAGGVFTLEQVVPRRHLWLLATGTGLGVYLAMLKTPTAWAQFERVILVHGVRYAKELSYQETVRSFQERYAAQFTFIPTLSRETAENALTGRITELLSNGLLSQTAGAAITPDDSHLMLCGNSAMINEVRAWLEPQGMGRHSRKQPGHYTIEQYH